MTQEESTVIAKPKDDWERACERMAEDLTKTRRQLKAPIRHRRPRRGRSGPSARQSACVSFTPMEVRDSLGPLSHRVRQGP